MQAPSPFEALALPFPLAIGACPQRTRRAEVVIGLSPESGLETHCFVAGRDSQHRRNLWRIPRIAPTAEGTQIAWRGDGQRLAASVFRTVVVTDLAGRVWRHTLPMPVLRLAYDGTGGLLALAGRVLYRCPETGGAEGGVEAILPGVDAVAVQDGIAHAASLGEEELAVADLDGTELRRVPVPGRRIETVSLRGGDFGLFLECRDRPADGFCRTTVHRCVDGGLFFDERIGVGIAEPGIGWHALDRDTIALLAELEEIAGLWLVTADGNRRRLSDERLEVDLMRWSPDGSAVLISGRDLDASGARRSQCLDRNGRLLWERAGGAMAAEWLDNERFVWASEEGGVPVRWTLAEAGRGAAPPPADRSHSGRSRPLPGGTGGADMILMGNESAPRLGVIYVMGPHRAFAAGAERLFYHHAIRAQAEAACRGGGLLLGLNGAGALGAGRDRRLPLERYDDAALADLRAAAAWLRGIGASRIALVAASLGCLPAIRFLADDPIDAAVLLNPVYTADIPPLHPWTQLYGPESLLEAALDRHAPAIRTPLLIVHGQRDPISPSQHSSDFVMALPEDVECEYLSVPDEGHIFQTDRGWRQLLGRTRAFLEASAAPARDVRA